jgi:hypothetical protein
MIYDVYPPHSSDFSSGVVQLDAIKDSAELFSVAKNTNWDGHSLTLMEVDDSAEVLRSIDMRIADQNLALGVLNTMRQADYDACRVALRLPNDGKDIGRLVYCWRRAGSPTVRIWREWL